MGEKIVVGVDGSEASENALRWAVDEGRLRQARVVAVHAWQAPVIPLDVTPAPAPHLVADLAELQSAAEEVVAQTVKKVVGDDSTVSVEPVAIEGPPASVLIDAAADAELLAVGSRGHGGFVGFVLGSVSRQVVDHAPCPVLVHRHAERGGS